LRHTALAERGVHQLAFDEKRTLPTPAMEIRDILSRSKDLESLYTLDQLQHSSAEFEQGCGVTFECHDAKKKLKEMSEKQNILRNPETQSYHWRCISIKLVLIN
jgi:hypothetical protein